MATRMSLFPCHAERMYQPRAVVSLYIKNVGIHYSKRPYPHLFIIVTATSASILRRVRRLNWSIKNMLDDAKSGCSDNSKGTGTRLVRAIQSVRSTLSSRIKELRRGLSVKVLFFLLGFYCATAFATVIGQTGDWDILSAGLAVVVVEGIGAIMYRASSRLFDRIRGLVTVFNYWKAGLSLGLFLDSFKYEMDMLIEKWNTFSFGMDSWSIIWQETAR